MFIFYSLLSFGEESDPSSVTEIMRAGEEEIKAEQCSGEGRGVVYSVSFDGAICSRSDGL